MAWQTPKTNWKAADVVSPTDMNRIEGNIEAIETGARTVDPAQVPSGNTGTLRQFLNWLPNRIKAITGKTNWWDAPSTTLEGANSHINATSNVHGVGISKYVALSSRSDHLVNWDTDIYGIPATATRWPAWSEVTSKPTTLTRTLKITTGTVSDGGTIPQTSGYSKYAYFVSMRAGYGHWYLEVRDTEWSDSYSGHRCWVNQSTRVVTVQFLHSRSSDGWVSATANYIEIAWNEV